MFGGKYNTLLTVLLIIAIVVIIALLGYLGYSIYNKYYINAGARDAVEAFEQAHGVDTNTVIKQKPQPELVQNTVIDENVISMEVPSGPEDNNNSTTHNNTSKNNTKKTTYNGYDVIGTISIPSIKIEYPILNEVTTKALKIAVVYLYGSGINEVGNTVIQGHNYRNGTFFSNLYKLKNGADIYITDTSGNKVQYKVYKNFEASATDTSFYNRDTNGKREITLSTCTDDANTRTIILAREV